MDADKLRKIIVETISEHERGPYVTTGVSNRHLHLSRGDLEILFGTGYELTPVKELLPGQYSSTDTLTVAGKKGKLERVRVLGPVRSSTQLEISVTDSFAIGVQAPVNESGNLRDAATVVIENPLNGARIERACAIAALRHVHLTPEFAARHGLRDKQTVSVEFSGVRAVVFGNVLLRVSKDFFDAMHIDTDEANAGGIKSGDVGKIIAPL